MAKVWGCERLLWRRGLMGDWAAAATERREAARAVAALAAMVRAGGIEPVAARAAAARAVADLARWRGRAAAPSNRTFLIRNNLPNMVLVARLTR